MKVLSLFDGISCGRVALEEAEIPIEEYVAYEIEETAIKISKKHFPQIKQMGSVIGADFTQYEGFDLIIGGSPCQDLSIQHSNRKGLGGNKSSLFWEFVRAIEEVKPKWFLFENVASMPIKDKEIITEALGVEPVLINSSIFLPQNRERLYWTNISFELPSSGKHCFKEVKEENVEEKYWYNKPFTLIEGKENIVAEIKLNTYESNRRVFGDDSEIGCLTCISGGYQEKKYYDPGRNQVRKLTPREYERLQGLPDDYTIGFSNTKRYSVCGNGWTIPVVATIFNGLKIL